MSIIAIIIANKALGQHSLIHETIRIKSGAWDDCGILVYSTLNHIKYALPQGYFSLPFMTIVSRFFGKAFT
jgi:hypothetical protein